MKTEGNAALQRLFDRLFHQIKNGCTKQKTDNNRYPIAEPMSKQCENKRMFMWDYYGNDLHSQGKRRKRELSLTGRAKDRVMPQGRVLC